MSSREEVLRVIDVLKANVEVFASFKRTIENKNVVVLLGTTRSGKSTLGNYLMSHTLYGIELRRRIFKIVCDDQNGPTIGQGSSSCTSVPVLYPLSAEIGMVDAPGFEDNRGIEQQIMSAIFNKQINSAASIKFILVCDIADIVNDNIGNFLSSLNQLSKVVSNYQDLSQSLAVIFTKDGLDYTQEDVIDLLNNKILQQLQLVANKELVQNFVNNKQLIGIFKMPCKEGEITESDGLAINIKEAVESCRSAPIDECKINLALSDTTTNFLLEIVAEYTDQSLFEQPVNTIIFPHINYFDIEDYVFASYDDELENVKSGLDVIENLLISEITEDLTRINKIVSSLNNLNVNIIGEFYLKLHLIICLDDFGLLEEPYANLILENYKKNLGKLKFKVTALITKVVAEQELRRRKTIVYVAHGAGMTLGAAAVTYCANSLYSARAASVVAGEAALSSVAAVAAGGVGLLVVGGLAASAYVLYKETYGKRNESRRAQGRE